MAKTKYRIALSTEEHEQLEKILQDESSSERAVLRARILLMSDENTTTKPTVTEVAEELGTTHTTVQTVRTTYATEGVEAAVFRKRRTVSHTDRKISDAVIKQIWKISKEPPPEGHNRWSVRLLSKECIERGIVDYISPASVHLVLQQKEEKMDSTCESEVQ